MSTLSTELVQLTVYSSPEITLVSSSSAPIPLDWKTSPTIRFAVHKPVKTPVPRRLDTLTVLAVPRDTEIAGWLLRSVLLVQLRRSRKEWVATTWLERLAEYGSGETDVEAIKDLVVSLGEYRESLERRESKLGEPARKELVALRRLIEPSTVH